MKTLESHKLDLCAYVRIGLLSSIFLGFTPSTLAMPQESKEELKESKEEPQESKEELQKSKGKPQVQEETFKKALPLIMNYIEQEWTSDNDKLDALKIRAQMTTVYREIYKNTMHYLHVCQAKEIGEQRQAYLNTRFLKACQGSDVDNKQHLQALLSMLKNGAKISTLGHDTEYQKIKDVLQNHLNQQLHETVWPNNNIETAQALLAAGADLEHKDVFENTILMSAIIYQQVKMIKFSVDAGAHLETEKRNGATPLIYAAQAKDAEIVKILLAAGADVEHVDETGTTALIWATHYGRLEAIEILLAAGADVEHVDKIGKTALMWAATHGHRKVFEILLAAGADVEHVEEMRQTLTLAENAGKGRNPQNADSVNNSV